MSRRLGTLALVLAVLASAAPLVADSCAGAAVCPLMRLANAVQRTAAGEQLLPSMNCCRPGTEPATSPVVASSHPAPELGAAPADDSPVPPRIAPPVPPLGRVAVAARSRAERRHAVGVFLIDSVFRI